MVLPDLEEFSQLEQEPLGAGLGGLRGAEAGEAMWIVAALGLRAGKKDLPASRLSAHELLKLVSILHGWLQDRARERGRERERESTLEAAPTQVARHVLQAKHVSQAACTLQSMLLRTKHRPPPAH